ncbi:hypothetical protein CEXT_75501 [Caerostris extrusa]|uniref:Uncharacterized protein n=1 Tax=Caerostris extrusa TaxID=172846 RepID=A0AAV4XTE7_CAEEX|nr:hypothetical protein CEXT_75501 [Caerostris extrusa]
MKNQRGENTEIPALLSAAEADMGFRLLQTATFSIKHYCNTIKNPHLNFLLPSQIQWWRHDSANCSVECGHCASNSVLKKQAS